MLKYRIITGIVLLPLLFSFLFLAGKLPVFILLMGFAALSIYETLGMLLPVVHKKFSQDKTSLLVYPLAHLVIAGLFLACSFWWEKMELAALLASFLTIFSLEVVSKRSVEDSVSIVLIGTFCLCYAALPWAFVWKLFLMRDHGLYLLFTLIIAMASDTGAYFAGSLFGHNKLSPRLSPSKSWEGFFGGILFSCLLTLSINYFANFIFGPWWLVLCLTVTGSVAGVIGDLAESCLKRFSGVKDSGKIFPGHGGFLDRTDSIVFVTPFVWFILYMYHSLLA